jgi:hypothetical protein
MSFWKDTGIRSRDFPHEIYPDVEWLNGEQTFTTLDLQIGAKTSSSLFYRLLFLLNEKRNVPQTQAPWMLDNPYH